MRQITRIAFLFSMLLVPALSFAQEAAAEPSPVLDWGPIAAAGIGVLVMLLVQLVKHFVPKLDAGKKQIIALVAAPLLTWAASAVSEALGQPVDFRTLVEAFLWATGTGLAAMGGFDVVKKLGENVGTK